MYDLPTAPSLIDIMFRSIICHPEILRSALIRRAELHDDYSALTTVPAAREAAIGMKRDCLRAYDLVGREDLPERERAARISAETGPLAVALNESARLQCLPRHLIMEILA